MYILRHKKLFEGHVKIIGKRKHLDDEAVRILEEYYPSTTSTKLLEREKTPREIY